ncbi:thiamine pyrophosphate-dependent enzyme [Rhodococcus sp. NPDC060176]|uniref:thiamine pyrophosphate-dependent enzyme n=1 Tax=Rhodococcus sp. NPDC060176 TaxID=3347062 RepID=UPI003657B88D
MTPVRDVAFEVMRECGMTRMFSNPGSTEVPLLVHLPDDFEFVLALHEGAVVGMATGHAIATGQPALVLLHTAAGLGNAVGALATSRANRAPLVVLVGQQDRRHLANEPFLAGRLAGLAGDYPVWEHQPGRPEDVPGAIRRAWHEAIERRGPALVIIPMDDWDAEFDVTVPVVGPLHIMRAPHDASRVVANIVDLLESASKPVIVVGAGADSPSAWSELIRLSESIGAPVWQEAFGSRAGFPQDHPQFAGHLPAGRSQLRHTLSDHDVAIVIGAGAFRQYGYEPGPLVPEGMPIIVISEDAEELHHSHALIGLLSEPASACAAINSRIRPSNRTPTLRTLLSVEAPVKGQGMTASHVFSALAQRIQEDTVVVEETPSTRPELHRLVPARAPRGFVSAAMGGLGFALPAAAGLRMGDPTRPVVAVIGDGSSLYAVQGLWSAAQYECGVLYIVLNNGRYAIMDKLAGDAGGKPIWPPFANVNITELATSLGCPARRVTTYDELLLTFDEVLPDLASRREPLLLDITVTSENL